VAQYREKRWRLLAAGVQRFLKYGHDSSNYTNVNALGRWAVKVIHGINAVGRWAVNIIHGVVLKTKRTLNL
jgi:hypothetical protein